MRRGLWLGLLATMVLVSPLAAVAQTIDKDEKRVKKYAVSPGGQFSAKAKGLCVCLEDSDPEVVHKVGRLLMNRTTADISGTKDVLVVFCQVGGYDQTTGELVVLHPVCDHWVPLAK